MRNWSHQRPNREPLYLKKEKEFLTQKELLDKRKRELELNYRKGVFKRISISEIRIHARKHDHIIENTLDILKKKRNN
jgi:hypothetical protein